MGFRWTSPGTGASQEPITADDESLTTRVSNGEALTSPLTTCSSPRPVSFLQPLFSSGRCQVPYLRYLAGCQCCRSTAHSHPSSPLSAIVPPSPFSLRSVQLCNTPLLQVQVALASRMRETRLCVSTLPVLFCFIRLRGNLPALPFTGPCSEISSRTPSEVLSLCVSAF